MADSNLDYRSERHQWFDAFLPHSMVVQWTTFTNIKAGHQNAGNCGGLYKGEWCNFKPYELKKHLGVYILQGVLPSP